MPKGDKYIGLYDYLKSSDKPIIKLSFTQIEQIIGDTLPESAIKYAEAWWSNDKTHSQAVSWMNAGYETDCVSDTYEEHAIVFVKG